MNFYKLIIAYDGTDYQGWQKQKDVKTISGELLKTFKKVFNQNPTIIGASRTDAGVHALNQIARIKTKLKIETSKMLLAWNNKLPGDITIRTIENCNENFYPLKNVKQKTYFYHFFLERPLPFNQRYGHFHHWPIDLKKLEKSLKIFIGKHDFRSYSTGYEMESTIRTIDDIKLIYIPEINVYRIEVKGKSFLHHMIRRIVGASLEVASRKQLKIEYLQQVLDEKDQEQTLPSAPAKGLMLSEIIFEH